MNDIRPIPTIGLMVLMLFGLFDVSIGAEEEKSPPTFFESSFIDHEIEYEINETQIGPVKINIPIPKSNVYEIQVDGQDKTETKTIVIKDGSVTQMMAIFNIHNIERDDGKIYAGVREFSFEQHKKENLSQEAAKYISGPTTECLVAYPSTFEYNTEKGYLFRTKTVCKIYGDKIVAIVVSAGDLYLNGYFLSIIILDFQSRGEPSRKIVHSWFNSLLKNNK